MTAPNQIAEVAAVLGEPARAAMLAALMDGRALTASELAATAGVTPQTASSHLSRLLSTGLIQLERQGRHRYHRLAGPSVARMLEGLMLHASQSTAPRHVPRTGPRNEAMRKARTCYDHFAGRLGVAIADAMVGRGLLELGGEAGVLTDKGTAFLNDVGIDMAPLLARRTRASGRILCRPCLDWSERRPHLGGVLGAALCSYCLDQRWVRRAPDSRAILITPKGERLFHERFGFRVA